MQHRPHLDCEDISLWGNFLAESSGTYRIDSWAPTGSFEPVHSGNWTYDQAAGGKQILDVIDVETLIDSAVAAGATAHPQQGYHFKLQFFQNPQKHKTFWVNCRLAPVEVLAGQLERKEGGIEVRGRARAKGLGFITMIPTVAVAAAAEAEADVLGAAIVPLPAAARSAEVLGAGVAASKGARPAEVGVEVLGAGFAASEEAVPTEVLGAGGVLPTTGGVLPTTGGVLPTTGSPAAIVALGAMVLIAVGAGILRARRGVI